MKVVCFGDSNTYGYDPRSFFGDHYRADCRWVDLLREKSGWNIRNEGMNGQEIPRRPLSITEEIDLLFVMLGTNDLLQRHTAESVSFQMEQFLSSLETLREKVLLISPPPMQRGEWVPNEHLIMESVRLGKYYRQLAGKLQIDFADAGEWKIPMAYDGVHFTEEGHKRFEDGLWKELCKRYEYD